MAEFSTILRGYYKLSMFEQGLERSGSASQAAEPLRPEDELFAGYEIKPWVFTPRIYKIIATAVLINIVTVVVLAQTQILTMKGCDSPFVGRVCQVLDTVYVGSVLFGTEREYADVAYDRTELADADITYIDVSNVGPPLSYPEGYFQLANPVQYAMLKQRSENPTMIPGITNNFTPNPTIGNELRNTRPNIPKANPNAVRGDLPDSPFEFEEDDDPLAEVNRPRGGKVAGSDSKNNNTNSDAKRPDDQTTAEKTPAPEEDVSKQDRFGVFINKRPIRDFGEETLDRIEKNEVSLDKPFKVIIAATLGLGTDGKTVVLQNPRPVPTESDATNDPEIVKLAHNAIIATGDAGWFGYLYMYEVKNVLITIEQTNDTFTATVRADQPSEQQAKQTASGFNGMLGIAKRAAGENDRAFLELAKTSNEGRSFLLNFEIPKPIVQEMILRELEKAKESPKKPNGNAAVVTNNNTGK